MTTTIRAANTSRVVVTVAVVAAVVDWSSKVVATVALDDRAVELGSVLVLRLSHNPGIAFGLGDRLPGALIVGLTALVTVVLAVAAVRGALGGAWPAGLVLGGAVANLMDRVIGGTVVDFLDLGWWPSFNLADVWLCIGCGLLALDAFRAQPTTE